MQKHCGILNYLASSKEAHHNTLFDIVDRRLCIRHLFTARKPGISFVLPGADEVKRLDGITMGSNPAEAASILRSRIIFTSLAHMGKKASVVNAARRKFEAEGSASKATLSSGGKKVELTAHKGYVPMYDNMKSSIYEADDSSWDPSFGEEAKSEKQEEVAGGADMVADADRRRELYEFVAKSCFTHKSFNIAFNVAARVLCHAHELDLVENKNRLKTLIDHISDPVSTILIGLGPYGSVPVLEDYEAFVAAARAYNVDEKSDAAVAWFRSTYCQDGAVAGGAVDEKDPIFYGKNRDNFMKFHALRAECLAKKPLPPYVPDFTAAISFESYAGLWPDSEERARNLTYAEFRLIGMHAFRAVCLEDDWSSAVSEIIAQPNLISDKPFFSVVPEGMAATLSVAHSVQFLLARSSLLQNDHLMAGRALGEDVSREDMSSRTLNVTDHIKGLMAKSVKDEDPFASL